ncbi:hypothetical protein TeGR_g10661 [Tetraparma gracilis]|uniref:Uncharacterized protein n=1 Tax=Tetraparma gracilis TaxID=2962635 RepID=A0ABQ6N796_9STRA|nr:hypothetical protein TeGR_g10661 [Tetraparma gracilis]
MSALPVYSQLLLHTHSDLFEFRSVINSLISCVRHTCALSSPYLDPDGCLAFQPVFADYASSPHLSQIPPALLAAVYNDVGAGVQSFGGYRETFLKASFELSPFEGAVVKNYAYVLEQADRVEEAAAMLAGLGEGGGVVDGGVKLLSATLCPPHHDSVEAARARYEKILGGLAEIVEEGGVGGGGDPAKEVAQMPLSWPYLGFPMRAMTESLGKAYSTLFPDIANNGIESNNLGGGGAKLRLGVVAEYAGNTSPGQLIQEALKGLPADDLEIVFFKAPGLTTEFAEEMERVAAETRELVPFDTRASQDVVKAGGVDVLLYIAIGMSPLTYYMASSRLAPVVCVYAHGHPITSGLPGSAVDYFLTSDSFALDRGADGREAYTEQAVKFDTLTAHLVPPGKGAGGGHGVDLDPGLNYYACLQYTKKIHPGFDEALAGVLGEDPGGRLLVLEGARRFIPRWKAGGFTDDMLDRIM